MPIGVLGMHLVSNYGSGDDSDIMVDATVKHMEDTEEDARVEQMEDIEVGAERIVPLIRLRGLRTG